MRSRYPAIFLPFGFNFYLKIGSRSFKSKKSHAQQTLALVHSTASTAKYSKPAWRHSNRTTFIDKPINDALPMVTGCLRLTPPNNLPVLVGKKTNNLRKRSGATIALAGRTKEPNHLLNDRLHSQLTKQVKHLKSICASNCKTSQNKAQLQINGLDYKWNSKW